MSTAETPAALGNPRRQGREWRCRCPACGGHSFTLAGGRDGRILVKCWAGECSVDEIFLRSLRLSPDHPGSRPSQPSPSDVEDDARRIARTQKIWEAASDARRNPVVRYLAGRGSTVSHRPACAGCGPARIPAGTD
jgi:hypothetical protein